MPLRVQWSHRFQSFHTWASANPAEASSASTVIAQADLRIMAADPEHLM